MRSTLLALALAFLALASICSAGSAGVRNGAIAGLVQSDGGPLEGVFVVACRQEGFPQVIRTVRSGADGRFVVGNCPLGKYILGFSKSGYKTITTEAGDPKQQTAVGAQVMVFIESGATSRAPDVSMEKLPSTEAADVSCSVVDAVTGDPVKHATLVLGPEVAGGGTDGTYRVRVVPEYDEAGNPKPHRLLVDADGYEPLQEQVEAPGGATTNHTVALQPRMVTLSGVVTLDPAIDPAEYGKVQIVVENVPGHVSQGKIVGAAGLFEVSVPASNSSQSRAYNLSFLLDGHQVGHLQGIIAPRAGVRMVGTPVTIQATVVEAMGQVVTASGQVPATDGLTSAVIVELGRSVPVQNGSFTLPNVPIGRPLSLVVTVRDPDTGKLEQGRLTFTAAAGGGFSLPVVVTSPIAGGQ